MSGKNKKYNENDIMFPAAAKRFGSGGAHRFIPTEKAKNTKGTFKKLIQIYLKEGKSLILIFVLLLVSNAVLLFIPTLVSRAIDAIEILRPHNPEYGFVTTLGIVILFGYVFDYICSTVQGWLMASTSQRIVQKLRQNLFDKIQLLPLLYHDTHSHGDIMSRLTNDIDNISGTVASSTSQLMNSAVTVIGSVIFMIMLSPHLTPVVLIALPLIIFLTKGVASRSRKMFSAQQKELGILNGTIEESITGLRMVKAFNQEENIISKFNETNKALLEHSTKAQIWSGFLMPLINVITNFIYALIAGIGGILAFYDIISVGVISGFITYSRLFVRPLNDIAGTFNTLQSALAGAERVFEVLEEAEESPDIPHAKVLSDVNGEISFKDVSFSYVSGQEVLKNISFDAKSGQTIALVGKTGAGKTTVVNLLTRFYDVSDGCIYIDGNDIKEYTRDSFRKAFTVVLQDTCLFSGTIAENIRYGKPEATDEEIIAASTVANADPFIRRLPNGYETMVSGAVDSLSRGQRQLIAIARAVLCSAPILILDEATSNVDANTEKKIQEALLRLRNGRTSFIIAHRLSTIKDADKILVIDDGKIIESGNHKELLSTNGVYARMYSNLHSHES